MNLVGLNTNDSVSVQVINIHIFPDCFIIYLYWPPYEQIMLSMHPPPPPPISGLPLLYLLNGPLAQIIRFICIL